jgi:hypothetical protein
MKKIFSKILIAILILGFFFTPVTPKIDTQNHFALVKNKVNAEDKWYFESGDTIIGGLGGGYVKYTSHGPYDDSTQCEAAAKTVKDGGDFISKPCYQSSAPTTKTADQNVDAGGAVRGQGDFFNCDITTIFTNCLVAGLYHVVFSLSAFLASLSARILDYFVFYALDSDSYKGDFITLGWALVRDISNILFIIALLYVAGKTVLGLNASNNKKIISMVILMALLINFSLFITKVVIDTSNIVARVFYANIENVDQDGNQNVSGYSDADGTTGKSISVGLVAQFDPQKIFQNSGIPQLVDGTVGPFAIFLILSIVLMFYMTYMFLSVAFVFIGRVAMLWILMIFSPLAFVSNTVPDFKIPKFNFREWKNELFNQSFLAPIFVFFLYLIISFGKLPVVSDVIDPNTLNNVGGTATNGTLNTFMKIFIPFIIIFTLVKIAKDTTIKMAGELASGMSKWGTILGAGALTLGTAGTAFLGRQVAGRSAAALSKREGAMEYGTERAKYRENLDAWKASDKKTRGARPTWEQHKTDYTVKTGNTLTDSFLTKVGGRINAAQIRNKKIDHGAHEYEDIKKKAGLEGVSDSNISAVEESKMIELFIKDKKNDIQSEIRSGNAKDHSGNAIEGENEFNIRNRKSIADKIGGAPGSAERAQAIADGDFDKKTNNLTDQGRKKVDETLKIEFNKVLEKTTKEVGKEKFEHFRTEARSKTNIIDRITAKSSSGSYDMTKINFEDKRANMISKGVLATLGVIALGLRTGLKNINLNPAKGQGDITKDLANIISTTIKDIGKNIKIDVGGGHGGGGGHDKGGHDDHGGGHGGGHH